MMKTYIITGASSDIGTVFLKELEKDGEKVTAHCQYFSNDSKLKELQSEFKNLDVRLSRCDLSSTEDTDRWRQTVCQVKCVSNFSMFGF